MELELTTSHSASSYGQPVFVLDGELIAHPEGVKALRELKGWNQQQLADEMGTSVRTVQGWEQGRPIMPMALKLMETFL
jgi:DNA-binding transcriptional regulator YiaG